MTKLEAYITNLKTDTLVEMCDEIYDWRKTGTLSSDSKIERVAIFLGVECRELEEIVIRILTTRLKKTVYMLFSDNPTEFLKGT